MTNDPPGAFYRLVQTDPPNLRDFLSHEELGIPPRRPLSRRERDRWRGVSHQDSWHAALIKAADSPWLGRYVAEVRVPADAAIRVEQTGRDRSYYTVWADPADLLSWVVSVALVEAVH